MVWSCFLFIRSGQNHLARHSERGKKTRQTKAEVGRHQGMDRPGVRQVQEGSGEHEKMEKTGCKIFCGAPTTLAVKELMMMMMMMKNYKSLVTSILLYSCETWTLLVDCVKRIQAFKTKFTRKRLHISYIDHKTNDWVWSKINFLVGQQGPLRATVRRRKLVWFRHVTCHDNLSKTTLQGTLEGGQHHGWRRKFRMDNIKEWTYLPMPEQLTKASCRKVKKRISVKSSLMSSLTTPLVKGLLVS